MIHRLGALAVLAAAIAPAAGAQEPAIFGETLEVRVVNLEVQVTDRDGLPVTGLAAEDFELRVDGEPVPIRYFTEVRGGTAVAAPPAAAGDDAVAAVPDLAPGDPVGTSYLVFVDDFFPYAHDRDKVLESLREQVSRLGPDDRMAIVAFDGRELTMLSTWSGSARDLERALRDARSRPAFGAQRAAERRSLASDLAATRSFPGVGRNRLSQLDTRLDVSERFYAETLEQQLVNVVSAATAALRGFAGPPGRKVLLLLSGGWPFDVADYVTREFGRLVVEQGVPRGAELYAPLIDTANQVGYSIFAVDVPGLSADSLADVEFDALPTEGDRFATFVRENNLQYTLHRVSAETGGRALINDLRLAALAAAEAATRSYYWIGFVPAWQGDDGRHPVEVAVRRTGLRSRTRGSYVDFSRQSEVTATVESILLFGDGPGVRPLPLFLGGARTKSKSSRLMAVPIAFELPVDQLTLLPGAGGRTADLELRLAVVDERGVRSQIPVVPIRLTVQADPAPPGATVRYETVIELRRMRSRMVVAVYDPAAGVLWSATAELKP